MRPPERRVKINRIEDNWNIFVVLQDFGMVQVECCFFMCKSLEGSENRLFSVASKIFAFSVKIVHFLRSRSSFEMGLLARLATGDHGDRPTFLTSKGLLSFRLPFLKIFSRQLSQTKQQESPWVGPFPAGGDSICI